MLEEYRAVAEDPYRDILSSLDGLPYVYLVSLRTFSKGRGFPHSCPDDLILDGAGKVIVGESSDFDTNRHQLLRLRGHIGYSIRPSQRRKDTVLVCWNNFRKPKS